MSERKSENLALAKEAGDMAGHMVEINRDNKLDWKDLADMEAFISVANISRGNILDDTKNELVGLIGDVFKKWYNVDNESDFNLINKLSGGILPAHSTLYEKYWEFSIRVIDNDIYIYNLGTLQQIITSSGGTKPIDSKEWAQYSKINNWDNSEINLTWVTTKLLLQEQQLLRQEEVRQSQAWQQPVSF